MSLTMHLFSDLHTEFYGDRGEADWFFKDLEPSGVDVCMLGGDILVAHDSLRFYERICERYPAVIAVAGNHEFYGWDFDEVLKELRNIDIPNFHFLERDTVEIKGQRFVGTTLWYGGGIECILNERFMNDFRMITKDGGYNKFIYRYGQESKQWLEKTVKRDDVVITHMLPSLHCIDNTYRANVMNDFYYSNCDHILANNRPRLWTHGHSHNHYDQVLHETRVLRNPHGYPGEADVNFNKNLRITI